MMSATTVTWGGGTAMSVVTGNTTLPCRCRGRTDDGFSIPDIALGRQSGSIIAVVRSRECADGEIGRLIAI